MERPPTIPGLTGLRGAAALWVVLFHLADGRSHIPVIERGSLGVDVFFILSGFVLAYVYAGKLTPGDIRGYLTFLRARVARVYPLHIFVLCAIGIAVLALPGFANGYPLPGRRFSADAFVASLLLIQNWVYWLPTCWNAPAWSLSAEWFAYLVFPFTLSVTQRWRTTAVPLLLAIASLGAYVAVMTLKGVRDPNVTGDPGMLRMFLEFACGCLLFRATVNGLRPLPWLADASAVSLLLVAVLWDNMIFLALPAIAAIVLITAQNAGWMARGLSCRPMMFLGNISYSLYMIHWAILNMAHWAVPDSAFNIPKMIGFKIVLLVAILVVSTLTYRLVELPARAWGRGMGRKPPVSHAVAGARPSGLLPSRAVSPTCGRR